MDNRVLLQRINLLTTKVKELATIVDQQKYITTDMILRIKFFESKFEIKEEEFNEFKTAFVAQLNEHKKSIADSSLRSEETRTFIDDRKPLGPRVP